MEFGETFEEAARREIREEYCTSVLDLKFISVTNVVRDNNGIPTHWVAIIFAARVEPQLVANGDPEKIDDLRWFSPSALPEPLHSKFFDHFNLVRATGII